MNTGRIFCVSGIDTDIGKTIATGVMARALLGAGIRVITQKFVQTGCQGLSEDIVRHREIMGIPLQDVDEAGITCPFIFPVPCSPHLAARLAGSKIDTRHIFAQTRQLSRQYDIVLLEGAGGLLVPVSEDVTFLDWLQDTGLPVILVTSSRLGSINHTLAAFEVLAGRGVELAGVVYNIDPATDTRISDDSRRIIEDAIGRYSFSCRMADLQLLENYKKNSDYESLLNIFTVIDN